MIEGIKGRNQNNFEKGEVYLAGLGNAGVPRGMADMPMLQTRVERPKVMEIVTKSFNNMPPPTKPLPTFKPRIGFGCIWHK